MRKSKRYVNPRHHHLQSKKNLGVWPHRRSCWRLGRKKNFSCSTTICRSTSVTDDKKISGGQPPATRPSTPGLQKKKLCISTTTTICRSTSTNSRKSFFRGQPPTRSVTFGSKKKISLPTCRLIPLITCNQKFLGGRPHRRSCWRLGRKKKLFTSLPRPPSPSADRPPPPTKKKKIRDQPPPTRSSTSGSEKKKLFTLHHRHHPSIDLHHRRSKKFFQKPTLPTRPTTSRSMERKSLREAVGRGEFLFGKKKRVK
jgi:hypothetical protein